MLIVFEGMDGAGTTTQAGLLAEALEAAGHAVLLTHEPTDGPVGMRIRSALRGEWCLPEGERMPPAVLALLFAADRLHHLAAEVVPALAEGKVVITDRYLHSSLAYQGLENDPAWVAGLNARAREPDLVFHLDVPVAVALERITRRAAARDIFEQEDFLARLAAGYEEAYRLRPTALVRLDGEGSVAGIGAQVLEVLASRGLTVGG